MKTKKRMMKMTKKKGDDDDDALSFFYKVNSSNGYLHYSNIRRYSQTYIHMYIQKKRLWTEIEKEMVGRISSGKSPSDS